MSELPGLSLEEIKKASELAEPTKEQLKNDLAEYIERRDAIKNNAEGLSVEITGSEYSTNLKQSDFEAIRKLREKKYTAAYRVWSPQQLELIEKFEASINEPITLDNKDEKSAFSGLEHSLIKSTNYRILRIQKKNDVTFQIVKVKK